MNPAHQNARVRAVTDLITDLIKGLVFIPMKAPVLIHTMDTSIGASPVIVTLVKVADVVSYRTMWLMILLNTHP